MTIQSCNDCSFSRMHYSKLILLYAWFCERLCIYNQLYYFTSYLNVTYGDVKSCPTPWIFSHFVRNGILTVCYQNYTESLYSDKKKSVVRAKLLLPCFI
ncbi:unnamed protein product [Ixodes pacificus]